MTVARAVWVSGHRNTAACVSDTLQQWRTDDKQFLLVLALSCTGHCEWL